MKTEEAYKHIKAAMKEDPSYAWAWHCNIAIPMQDEGVPHEKANQCAARVMQTLWGVDTRQCKEYSS